MVPAFNTTRICRNCSSDIKASCRGSITAAETMNWCSCASASLGPLAINCLASGLLRSDLHVERDDRLLLDDEYDMSGQIKAPIGHTVTHRLHLSNHVGRPIRSSCEAIKDRDYRGMTPIMSCGRPYRRMVTPSSAAPCLHHPKRSAWRRRAALPSHHWPPRTRNLAFNPSPRRRYRSVPTELPRGALGCSGGHSPNPMPDCAHPCRIACASRGACHRQPLQSQ